MGRAKKRGLRHGTENCRHERDHLWSICSVTNEAMSKPEKYKYSR